MLGAIASGASSLLGNKWVRDKAKTALNPNEGVFDDVFKKSKENMSKEEKFRSDVNRGSNRSKITYGNEKKSTDKKGKKDGIDLKLIIAAAGLLYSFMK